MIHSHHSLTLSNVLLIINLGAFTFSREQGPTFKERESVLPVSPVVTGPLVLRIAFAQYTVGDKRQSGMAISKEVTIL